MLNLVLLIWSCVVWLFFHHKEDLRDCLDDLKLELTTDWVAVGLAMTIAALSQWSTISIFHLFLCASFATTIPTEGFTQNDFIGWPQDRLRTIYFTAFRILRIVLLSYFIYRFVRFWGNAPGQCFHLSRDPGIPWLRTLHISDDVNEKFVIVFMALCILLDISIVIGILVYMSNANYRNRVAQNIKAVNAQDKTERFQRVLLLVRNVAGGFLVLASSVLGIQVVLANRTQIIGDENSFSFGQVTALVTLVVSFYKIGDSLHSKLCVPS